MSQPQDTTDLPSLAMIAEAMDFTMTEIDLNRGRELSERQRAKLQRIQRRTLLVGAGVFFMLAFVAALMIYIGQRNQQIVFSLIGVLATVLNAIILGLLARGYLRLSADLREKQPIEIYEGHLERVLRPNGQVNNYVLRVYNRDFPVTKEVFKQFRHGKVYSLYATLHANVLISAECLSDPNN
jgi:hypothetical protein